ncbi:MAG: GBS Bsp-like repeat-containing protein, partial [Christensenellaceae bacterium]
MNIWKKIVLSVFSLGICFGIWGLVSTSDTAQAVDASGGPFTVFIQAGHSPSSVGVGNKANGVKESKINEEVTIKFYNSLKARGINAVFVNPITLNSTLPSVIKTGPNPSNKQYQYYSPEPAMLTAITKPWTFDASLKAKPDLVFALHHNGWTSSAANGYELYYSSDTSAGEYGKTAQDAARSREMALLIDAQFRKPSFHLIPRSPSVKDDSTNNGITRRAPAPSVLIEAGFMSNPADFAAMQNAGNQQMLADRIADAVVLYRDKYSQDTPPKLNSLTTSPTPTKNPIFTLNMDISAGRGIKDVEVAVWTAKKNQADLKWYKATNVGGNKWQLNISAKDYGYAMDTYAFHIYATTNTGIRAFVGNTAIAFQPSSALPAFAKGGGLQAYPITEKSSTFVAAANNVYSESGIASVQYAVWTEKNNQSDLRWYNGVYNGQGVWVANIDAKDYKDLAGKYNVHAYATDNLGRTSILAGTSVTLKHKDYEPPKAAAVFTNETGKATANMEVYINGVKDEFSGAKGVAKVDVAVWSTKNAQS